MKALIPALMFPALFLLIFAGIPVSFSLMLVSVAAGWFIFGDVLFQQLFGAVHSVASNFILASIPLFVLMGSILERSGVASRLFQAMQIWLGRLPGGLALATIAMGAIFAAASGIVGAVEIVIGLMAIPTMRAFKYNNALISGTICAGGSLGTIIPPTVIAVVYAALAQLSIGELFAAVILPGAIMVLLFGAYVVLRCVIWPEDGPPISSELDKPLGEKLWITFTALFPAMILITAVLGSMLSGIASPTEAAAVGVTGALLLALCYREMSWKVLRECLSSTINISAMILLIVVGGTMFTGIFAAGKGSQLILSLVESIGGGNFEIIAFFLFIVFILGFILDWISIILICVPIFTPVIRAAGIDPIWFAAMVLVTIQTSYLTPPMAPSIFYLRSIAPKDITYKEMYWGVIPFIALQFVTLFIVALVPATATWLPKLLVGF
ncbi:TRAP transporter large permease [Mycoplana ramosa]|uniref:TRAP transporter large permease protein n=1 Tax=Mycoplana ramosa TaxID=40837 RepID=A0ABW3YYZ9_MYCRA